MKKAPFKSSFWLFNVISKLIVYVNAEMVNQVTSINMAIYTMKIVSKQLHRNTHGNNNDANHGCKQSKYKRENFSGLD